MEVLISGGYIILPQLLPQPLDMLCCLFSVYDLLIAGREKAVAWHHGQTQAGRGELRQVHHKGAEGDLLGLLQERGQEGSPGGLPHPGRLPDRLHPPQLRALPPPARVGRVPRGGADHQGVHAGGHHSRPQVARGVRAGLLQVL